MEFHDKDATEDNEAMPHWRRLDTLPPEIILHICSFLSAKFVISVFSCVCKKFQELVECDTTWKMRIFRRWPKSYPLVPPVGDFDWKAACIAREEQYRLWNNHLENMRKYHFLGAHYGCVNVVQLIEQGKRCLSGGRDGDLKLWNLDPESLADQPFNFEHVNISSCLMKTSHHANAWIWDTEYDSIKKYIYSAGFDCTIKCWDLKSSSKPLKTYTLSSPILCLAYNADQLVSGCYGRSVSIFDTRNNHGPVLKHIFHKKPVICIAADDKYVISGSEDQSLIVYDKIAAKILKKLELEWFPLSMSYGEGQLLVGDVNSFIHVIDPRHAEFSLLHTFSMGHSRKVTGIQHSVGSVITCSTDEIIRILTFSTGHSKKVTGIQHSVGSVITCSTDKTIRILELNVDSEPVAVIEVIKVTGIQHSVGSVITCSTDKTIKILTFSTGHSKKVTGIQHSIGSVITCSTDKTIRILEPNVDAEPVAVIESTNEIARISFCNDILACANVDDSITVWVPGDTFD